MVALQIADQGEGKIPNLGLIKLQDPESRKYFLADTSDVSVRQAYEVWWNNLRKQNKELFQRVGVDMATLYTGQDYVKGLTELFKRRG